MAEHKTPLGRARGLGSAKHGVGHFIGQRVSAVALVFLVCFGLAQTPGLAKGGYDGAWAWLGHPLNAALLGLLAVTALYHGQLGLRVVIEDYVRRRLTRDALLILNTFTWIAAAAVIVVSLIKVSVGAGADSP
jgi:succinate dehydrogenase / fumarate reductase membrane anchor subunit